MCCCVLVQAMLIHLDEHITPLKEGEKIHVKLNVNHKKTSSESMTAQSTSSKGKGGFGLKPPPPAGSTVYVSDDITSSNTTSSNSASNHGSNEDEDWGDFTSS